MLVALKRLLNAITIVFIQFEDKIIRDSLIFSLKLKKILNLIYP